MNSQNQPQTLVRFTGFDRTRGVTEVFRVGTARHADGLEPAEVYAPLLTGGVALTAEIGIWGTPLGARLPASLKLTVINDGSLGSLGGLGTAFIGWPLEVLEGLRGQALADHHATFKGVITARDLDETSLSLTAFDRLTLLQRELQTVSYLGDGSPTEGPGDLAGQLKPLALGHCLNVPAVAVDRARHLWQLADPAWCPIPLKVTIERLWAAGVPIVLADDSPELESQDPPDGQALFDSTRGLVKLATDATDGSGEVEVTADIRVEAVTDGSSHPVALARLVASAGGLGEALDSASFDALKAAAPAVESGLWLASGGEALTVLDRLLADVGAFRLLTGAGLLRVGRFDAPTAQSKGDCAWTVNEARLQQGSLKISSLGAPARAYRVAFDRNNLVQTTSLAGGADPARLDFLASESRYQTASGGIEDAYPTAEAMTLETGLVGSEAAGALALQLVGLFGQPRDLVTLETALPAGALQPGDQVWLHHRRFWPRGQAFRLWRLASKGQGLVSLGMIG